MLYFSFALILAITFTWRNNSANADVYVFKDKNGILTFSEVPKKGFQKIETDKAPPPPPPRDTIAGSAPASSGTAFAVAPGLLITNQHVIAGCSSVDVYSADMSGPGFVVKADAQIDLALLQVNGLKGAIAQLRGSRNIRLGEQVMVFGFPLTGALSSGGNFTSGLVSALRGLNDAAAALQITAPVQPGNSGAPLMDASGLIIGVVQAKLNAIRAAITIGDIPQNVNFAISLEVLANFLVKNKVDFREGVVSAPLDTARVAELAQGFTYRVECRASAQQHAGVPAPPVNTSFEDLIRRASDRYTVDADLIRAMIKTGSNFNSKLRSNKGAMGLMQLMPDTARFYSIRNAYDPIENIDAGVRHLKTLLERYQGDLELSLAAYNTGSGAVEKYGGIPPYRETREYIRSVLRFYDSYRATH